MPSRRWRGGPGRAGRTQQASCPPFPPLGPCRAQPTPHEATREQSCKRRCRPTRGLKGPAGFVRSECACALGGHAVSRNPVAARRWLPPGSQLPPSFPPAKGSAEGRLQAERGEVKGGRQSERAARRGDYN